MNVTLLHTAYGLTPGTREFAEQIAAASGGELTMPDFYRGEIFTDQDSAMGHLEKVGYMELYSRLDGLDVTDQILVGTSLGASFAQRMVTQGAKPARLVLIGNVNPHKPERPWPGVDTQVHHFTQDTFVDPALVATLGQAVTASGARFEHVPTEGPGHLFFEPRLPEYDPDLTARTIQQIVS